MLGSIAGSDELWKTLLGHSFHSVSYLINEMSLRSTCLKRVVCCAGTTEEVLIIPGVLEMGIPSFIRSSTGQASLR